MKIFRILISNDRNGEIIPWNSANINYPPNEIVNYLDSNTNKFFSFYFNNEKDFNIIINFLNLNNIKFEIITKNISSNDIFWTDNIQSIIEISDEEFDREQDIINSL